MLLQNLRHRDFTGAALREIRSMRNYLKKLLETREKIESTAFFSRGLIYILVPAMTLLQWLMVQLCYQTVGESFAMSPVYILLEASLLFVLDALLALCTGRWWIGYAVTLPVAFVYGVLNHYVIDMHGTPVSVRDVGNIGTTGEVLAGYRLEISGSVILQGVLLLVGLAGIYLLRRVGLRQQRWDRTRVLVRAGCFALSAVLIFFGFFGPAPLKPSVTRSWDWAPPLRTYGAMSCLLENALSANDILLCPEGYSPETAEKIAAKYDSPAAEAEVQPDIIFILNETYYDVSLVTDLHTDVNPFAALDQRDDLIRGYATSPVIGGGTNCSEYEFLTGNSLHLTPGITPFQSLDMQGADSVVSRLEAQGYSTISVNSEHRENYYRHTGYPGLGFDRVYNDLDFTHREYYADRCYETDRCLYEHMIDWYEDMGDGPRFAYLLTIQNHGGYELCQPEDDTVHVLDDYGRYSDQMNEYFTSLALSAEALCDLIEYFEQGDRPVVLCMVGDHTTCFAPKIISEELTDEETDLILRSTPYVVWSNCGLEDDFLPEYVSLHSLGPCVLTGAGVGGRYDRFVAEMCSEVPVFLSGGDWYDSEGSRHEAESVEQMPEILQDYVYMLHNNLAGGENRQDDFFRGE